MARALVLAAVVSMALATSTTAAERAPVVVELFTSQSCYSCPPAETYLGELAQRDGIVALEFHVDYWNDLLYGLAGRWTDVHSSPAHTDRQRRYAKQIKGGGVYTPQMVIDGRAQAVGSRPRDVERAIAAAHAAGPARPSVTVRDAPDGLSIRIAGPAPAQPTPVWLARYRQRETTRVHAGENRGKTLINHHVVTGLTEIGTWSGGVASLSVPVAPTPGEGCAVLVQAADAGPILAAGVCPKAPAPGGYSPPGHRLRL